MAEGQLTGLLRKLVVARPDPKKLLEDPIDQKHVMNMAILRYD